MEEEPLLDTDMLMSEFSDTLFSTLSSHQPVAWPNPREIGNPRLTFVTWKLLLASSSALYLCPGDAAGHP